MITMGEIGEKWDLVVTFDLRSTRLNCILQDFFRDTLLDHIFALKYVPKYAKYGIWDAFLGAIDMVKWGIPEKIL